MTVNGITPNIHTFNAALNVATTLKTNEVLDFTKKILADITKFKLKPSLTTYYYLLRILSNFGNYIFSYITKIFYIHECLRVYSLKQVMRHITAL